MSIIKSTSYSKLPQWAQFEEDIAEFFEGSRQRGSGNSWLYKGDVVCDNYLIECKFTSKDYYSLNVKTWEKIVDEAIMSYKIPLFACRSKLGGDYLICRSLDSDGLIDDDYLNNLLEKKNIIKNKSFKVTNEGLMILKGIKATHNLICLKLDLD